MEIQVMRELLSKLTILLNEVNVQKLAVCGHSGL